MVYNDYVVKYDPEKDSARDLLRRILNTLIIKRLKSNKPAVTFVAGSSGEGKSITTLHLIYLLCKQLKIDDEQFLKFINVMNVYTPLEYSQKIEKLLYDKEYKKARFLIVHEARELVKATNWQGFINTAISDVNAMSRSVKRLGFFTIAQNIRDVDIKIRYTLNYYIKITRPYKKTARLYIYKIWFDDRDLDKPKIRKRKIGGHIILPSGKVKPHQPIYFNLGKPPQKFIDIIEKEDYEAKSKILKHKLDKLFKEMSKDVEVGNKKIDTMVGYYIKHPESLKYIGKQRKGKWSTVAEFKKMHDLTPSEVKIFEEKLNQSFKEKGVI